MNVQDYKPLPNACVKNLCDKLFEKRKAGAMEVEQLVKTYVSKNKKDEIDKILQIFGQEFIVSPNANVRKGALFGLASVAIGLGQICHLYSDQLVAPIFQALRDTDSQVRYAACEALYNILKVLHVHSLEYLNDLFEALCTATADPEMSVRQVVDHCDRLLRDIVIQNRIIDVKAFMRIVSGHLRTRIPFTRKFLVGWIGTLNSVPGLTIIQYIPQLLDGLLTILGDENPDIRRNCDVLLNDFLSNTIKDPDTVNVLSMIHILIRHCQESTRLLASLSLDERTAEALLNFSGPNLSPERLRQITSLQWIRQFIHISTSKGLQLIPLVAPILSAVLPCIDDRDDLDDRTALKRAVDINEVLMNFVHNLQQSCPESGECDLNCSAFLKVIYGTFDHPSVLTRLAALRWIEVLLSVNPEAVFANSTEFMPLLLKLLSDPAVEVVHSTVSLVGCLCKHPVAHHASGDDRASVQRLFSSLVRKGLVALPASLCNAVAADRERSNLLCLRFLYDLVQRFINDPQMLSEKGNLIITDLCLALGAKSVYYMMALIVSNLLKPKEAFIIVQTLNQILLTQPSVLDFREYLYTIDLNKDAELFKELYRAWCHNPVALLAFCLLTRNYTHCCEIVKSFGELAMSVEILVELDRLIQLLESPVFARLRLHLVDKRYSPALQETLYCLLMCLPQTEAFDILRRRLQCLPSHILNQTMSAASRSDNVDFNALLVHFREVQRLHHENRVKEEALMVDAKETRGATSTANIMRAATTNTTSTAISGTATASIPIELGFLQSEELTNPLMANSTQFFVKGLQRLGIEAIPPRESSGN
ncbi:protein VAC14 [Echinococcus multilocularis]|uniref:Protein VAC14 homolog n=1 Tax=Echinococcus multilocularis TaxID=6211 RepID=A0A068YA39_ECHMU|nr:protein VAC14 [Echinococcus multilocularis]